MPLLLMACGQCAVCMYLVITVIVSYVVYSISLLVVILVLESDLCTGMYYLARPVDFMAPPNQFCFPVEIPRPPLLTLHQMYFGYNFQAFQFQT